MISINCGVNYTTRVVVLEYIPSDSQVANIFTKPLANAKFKMPRERLGLVENTLLAKKEFIFFIYYSISSLRLMTYQ